MEKRTFYNVNGSAGAWVNIPATIPCRYMEIIEGEDLSVAAVGLQYQTKQDNFASTLLALPAETIAIGDKVAIGQGRGGVLGYPAYNSAGESIAATVIAKVLSNTVAATKVLVIEYP